ncbi:MAG: MFS transporter [Rhodospirillales bacterium]
MKLTKFNTPIMVLILGTVILCISFGVRSSLGVYMKPISLDLGWGRETFAFAVALQSLIWGISTPMMGYLADRFGPAKIVALGAIIYTAGLYIMSQATAPLDATIGIGMLTGFALSMTGFPIILSVIARRFPPERRSLVLGIGSAGGSSGQLILVPYGQWLINENGWVQSLIILAIMTAIIVPLTASLAGGNARASDDHSKQNFGDAMKEASRHRGYQLLIFGYFVCGFQTMFIGAHLPAYLSDLGQSDWVGATALALIGGFNIIGCIFWGLAGDRRSKKMLLAAIYSLRALVMIGFILLPMTTPIVIVLSAAMGLLWLGTVPLTTGVVIQVFGTQYMATLVGFTFLGHQVGSFLGIWLGGLIFDATGSYDPIFWGGVILGVIATIVHFPLDDQPVARLSQEAAQAVT